MTGGTGLAARVEATENSVGSSLEEEEQSAVFLVLMWPVVVIQIDDMSVACLSSESRQYDAR